MAATIVSELEQNVQHLHAGYMMQWDMWEH